MKINYKGYKISQDENNHHVAIFKDNQLVFHAQIDKKLNKEELKQQIDFYLYLVKKAEE